MSQRNVRIRAISSYLPLKTVTMGKSGTVSSFLCTSYILYFEVAARCHVTLGKYFRTFLWIKTWKETIITVILLYLSKLRMYFTWMKYSACTFPRLLGYFPSVRSSQNLYEALTLQLVCAAFTSCGSVAVSASVSPSLNLWGKPERFSHVL